MEAAGGEDPVRGIQVPGKELIVRSETAGSGAREAESLKGNKYTEQCTKHGINFSTITLEVYRGMGREAVGTLKKLVPHREMARRISTSVVVATAEALRAREASVAMDLVKLNLPGEIWTVSFWLRPSLKSKNKKTTHT